MHAEAVSLPESWIRLADAEEDRCHRYNHAKLIFTLVECVLLVGTLAALTWTGTASSLLAFAMSAPAPAWLGHLCFLLLIGLIVRLVLLPAQFLDEYWLDHRFALVCHGPGSWLWEWTCRSVLFGVAIAALLLPVVETLRWWVWMWLPWSLAFLLARPLFYDWIYYPLLAWFYPVEFLRHESFELPGIGRVTLPVFQVKVSHKTCRANAAIRLRGKRTAIYVSDTLIDEFTDGEERVVMAHEFGHLYDHLHLEERTRAGVAQAHRKVKLGASQLLAGLCSLVLLHFFGPGVGIHAVTDLEAFPVAAALTLTLAQAFAPFLCAEARRDECDADEYALAITGDVENYISVMRKLRQMNLEESCSHPVGRLLFETHPSYAERVATALRHRSRHAGRRRGRGKSWRSGRGGHRR